jgi:hypothetical protein
LRNPKIQIILNTMEELIVILGALIILTLSIAGMNIYRCRTDVLTGPYISNAGRHLTVPTERVDRTSRAIAENRRATHPFLRRWKPDSLAPDARGKATGHSSHLPTDPDQPHGGFQSTVISMKEFNDKRVADLPPAESGLIRSRASPTDADHDDYKMKSVSD